MFNVPQGTNRGLGAWLSPKELRTHLPRVHYQRYALQAAIDAIALAAAIVAATYLRFEFSISGPQLRSLLLLLPVFVAVHLLLCASAGLYAGRWSYGSFEEIATLARGVAASTVVLTALDATVFDRGIPVSACVAAGPSALVLMGAARYVWRARLERILRPSLERSARVIVFGAGEGGHQIITAMMRNPDSRWFPVAVIDDDPLAGNLSIKGVRVAGGRERLGEVAVSTEATALVIAIPSASAGLIRELSQLAEAAKLSVMVLPAVGELLGASVGVEHIRPLTEADLLGRREIDTDLTAIAGYLTGRRILVTGAGGSIGSELCRQIVRFGPGPARDARSRRVGVARRPAVDRGTGDARRPQPRRLRHPGPPIACSPSSPSTDPTSCSTPPP